MLRKRLIRTNEYYYHITTRTNNKEWFAIPLEEVWKICEEALKKANREVPVVISQFVLMANHYHLLVRTKNADIDIFMFWLNKEIVASIRKRTNRINRINRFFASGYKWTLITHPKYFKNVFKYIYQNPLRARIVEKCEHYPYSTKFYTHNQMKVSFPFTPIHYLENNMEFLNDRFNPKENKVIKRGLSRTMYKESRLLITPN